VRSQHSYRWPQLCLVRYGEWSIEYGHDLLKYSDVLNASFAEERDSNVAVKVKKVLEQARTIFCSHYGPEHSVSKEIEDKLKSLTL